MNILLSVVVIFISILAYACICGLLVNFIENGRNPISRLLYDWEAHEYVILWPVWFIWFPFLFLCKVVYEIFSVCAGR